MVDCCWWCHRSSARLVRLIFCGSRGNVTMDLLAVAVPVPLSSRGITGEDQAEENHRAAQRPCGSITTAVASCSPPSFSSDDEDGVSTSSFCSSTSTLYSDDDEEERGEEEVGSPKGLICDNSPLSKMSDLMAQLPIKRGLSRHYDGKSQSYTSLASVTSVHDLPKPERGPARKKLKLCRSYGSAGMADQVVGGGGGCPGALKLRLPPPTPAAHPLKPAAAAAVMVGNKTGSSSTSSSLQLPPTTTIGAERSGGFLRSTWRPPPAAPAQRRPVTFPATASHPQALLFA